MKQLHLLQDWRQFRLKSLILWLLSGILALGIATLPAQATGVYDLPSLSAGSPTWVVDSADAISLANENKLNGDLKKLAQQTRNEVRLVIIRRLDYGETIDSFADKLFSQWYPTAEAQANQTLLVVDTLTNSTAIRRGGAVEPLLSDDIAQSIVGETVAIPLREGAKYNQAFLDASNRLSAVLSGQPDPGPPTAREINIESTFASAEETNDTSATLWVVVLLVLATAIPMATYFWYVGLPGK